MTGEQNLRKFNQMSKEEQRELASRGGKAKAKKMAERKRLKEFIELALDRKIKTPDGEKTTQELMAIKAVQEALKGDWKAYEIVVALSGQKPAEKVMLADVSKETIQAVEDFLNDDEE